MDWGSSVLKLEHNCPVCKETFWLDCGRVTGIFDMRRVTIEIKPLYTSGTMLLCSADCQETHKDARRRANAAYDSIMADFQEER